MLRISARLLAFIVIISSMANMSNTSASKPISADMLFEDPIFYTTTGSAPKQIVTEHFNNDGKLDIAVTNEASGELAVFINQGDGIFGNPQLYTIGGNPIGIDSKDLNNDGKADIVTANHMSNSISVFINNGDGTFLSPVFYSGVKSPTDVEIGMTSNPNTSGLPQILALSSVDDRVIWYNNQGNGIFQLDFFYFPVNAFPLSMEFVDINNDKISDIITSNLIAGTVDVRKGRGFGSFDPIVSHDTDKGPSHIAIGDLNNNNTIDIVSTNRFSDTISILSNNGDGTFQPKINLPVGDFPLSSFIAELNNDGQQDIITTNYDDNTIYVYLANNGSFDQPIIYNVGAKPNYVIAADLNGDVSKELIVSNGDSNNIAIFINKTAPHRYFLPAIIK